MNSHTDVTVGKELVYALNSEGKHVYIDDVENGLNCNCTCPACGGQLIARNEGKKYKHHFAHYNKVECDYVCQTNIHCLAEEILKEEKTIILPPDFENCGNWRCVYDPRTFCCAIDHIESEKRISDIIPDIVITSSQATILVEIYVTHAVDNEKRNRIEKIGNCFVIEINLSDLAYKDLTKEELRICLKDLNRVKWIFNPNTYPLHKNYEGSIERYKIDKERNLVVCPQGRLHRRPLSSCMNCSVYHGTEGEEVRCFYSCVFSNKPQEKLPSLQPLKQYMNKILQPGDMRPLSSFGGLPLK